MREDKVRERKEADDPPRRWVAVSLGIFLGLTPLIITGADLYDYSELPKALFIKLGALVFGIVLIFSATRPHGRFRLLATPLDGPILAFLTWASLSVIWAYDKYGALSRLSHLLAAWLIYLVVREWAGDREKKAIAIALASSSFLVALLGLLQGWLGVEWVLQTKGPASTFGNKLLAGDFMVFAVPVLAIILLTKGRLIVRVLALVVLAAVLAYLVAAVTKGAVVAVILELAAAAILLALPKLRDAGRRQFRLALASVAFVILVISAGLGLEIGGKTNWAPKAWAHQFTLIRRTVESEFLGRTASPGRHPAHAAGATDESSASVRFAVWRNTLGMVRDHPLVGVGLNNFQVFYPVYAFTRAVDTRVLKSEEWPQTHNDHLQTLAELGIVGFLLGGWFLWRIGRHVVPVLWGTESRLLVVACVTATIGLLVDMFLDFPLQTSLVPLLAAVCVGLMASEIERKHSVRVKPTALSSAKKDIVPVLLAGLCVTWGIWSQMREVGGSYYLVRAFGATERQDWPSAIAFGTATLRYNPRCHQALQFMSEAYYQVGQPAEAAQAAEAVLKMRPYYANALNNLALARAKMGDRQGAIEAYRRAVSITPYNDQMHAAIGRLCLSEKRYPEAVDSFRTARQHSPNDPAYAFGLGLAHYHLAELRQSKEAFQMAVEKAPPTAEYYYYLGLTEMRLGQIPDAELNIGRALHLQPSWREAQALSRVLTSYQARLNAAAKQDR